MGALFFFCLNNKINILAEVYVTPDLLNYGRPYVYLTIHVDKTNDDFIMKEIKPFIFDIWQKLSDY
jgi:hypothetical protein